MITGRGRSYFLTKTRPRHLAPAPNRPRRRRAAVTLALALIAAPFPAALAQQDQPFQAFEIRRTYGSDMGVSSPIGVAYRPQSDTLVVVDGEGMAVEATRAGEAVAQPFAVAGDALTLAVDGAGDMITISDGSLQTTSPGGGPKSGRAAPVAAAAGAAFDAGTGSLLLLEGNAVVNADTGQRTTLGGNGNQPYRGLAIDPTAGLIYVGSPFGRTVQVFDRTGAGVRTIDLSGIEIGDQQGMTIAPSADPTDDPSVQRLYLADASGAMIEVAIEAELVVAASTSSTANLLRTYNTWQFSPSSPDPSGVVWLPYRNQLFISDSEVEEMGIFAGVNLWYVQPPSGANTGAGNTTSFNTEPTGVGFDPGSGPTSRRIFISNDNGGGKIDIVNLGANGEYDLTDTRTSFPTNGFGMAVDSEDVTYHQGNGHLYIVDGVGREVWDVNPGPNGIFQGGGSDDIITHFDIGVHGAVDPEGIAYSADSGRLLVVDDPSRSVYELETNGTLVNDINLPTGLGLRMAGITLAPASNGSGAISMYIVDRQVDNNNDPNENDGLMFETTAPLIPAGNQPPLANAGPDQQINSSLPASATLDGSLSTDDTGIVSYLWSQVSGPTTATITNPSGVTTGVTNLQAGSYTFRLTVTDAEPLSDTDEVVVTVIGPGGPFTWDGAIATSADDAEELGTGGMRLANADLELVVKGTDVQTVGLRFTNVTIPQGSTINSAYVQFQANSISSGAANLVIEAQASDNAPPFVSQTFNISSRTTGGQSAQWNVLQWDVVNEVGPDQQTADLKFVIQEVVQRSGWNAGNAIALIFTGSGTRVAESFDALSFTPELHVVYSTGGPPPNQPPIANAGPDQQVALALPATATLDGTGSTDDGGTANLTYLWTQLSGPSAGLTNANSAIATASLPQFGSYTFRLTVTDADGASDTDDVMVTATDPSGPLTFETAVAVGSDDAEQKATGRLTLTNGDLDLVLDSTTNMIVGLRFTGVNIPIGANITSAHIQFRSDESQSGTTNLNIYAHDIANAPAFASIKFNISNRTGTSAVVPWTPQAWTANQAGPAQQTPNLAAIVSELTASGSGWASGNAMVFIITGSGKRTADSFEGAFATRLLIEYTTP